MNASFVLIKSAIKFTQVFSIFNFLQKNNSAET